MKTLAIRLEDNIHAQLAVIAQLEELTVTDAIRQAVDQWIDARRDSPALKARAQAVLDDIEQEAANRRGALAALLGETTPASSPDEATTDSSQAPPVRRTRGKGQDPASG